MRMRTFTANDMPAAMAMVREALGDNAVILNTSHKGKGPVTITAAIDEDADIPAAAPPTAKRSTPSPEKPIQRNNEQADQLRYDLQEVLRFHNLPELFIAKIMQLATDRELAAFQALQSISPAARDSGKLLQLGLEKLLDAYFAFQPLDFATPGSRIMLVGAPGIGKTLTIAKMAAKLVMDDKKNGSGITVVTTDNKRAGGFEQLNSLTSIMGIELKAADDTKELKAILNACQPHTRVLIDTAGCNPYEPSEIKELKQLASLAGIEPVMVLPAGADSMESIDTVEAFTTLPIERLLVTRADTAKRFGGVLAAAASHKLAFCHTSNSSSIIDSLNPLGAHDLAGLLLNYKKRH